jgi:hypothetical protein
VDPRFRCFPGVFLEERIDLRALKDRRSLRNSRPGFLSSSAFVCLFRLFRPCRSSAVSPGNMLLKTPYIFKNSYGPLLYPGQVPPRTHRESHSRYAGSTSVCVSHDLLVTAFSRCPTVPRSDFTRHAYRCPTHAKSVEPRLAFEVR